MVFSFSCCYYLGFVLLLILYLIFINVNVVYFFGGRVEVEIRLHMSEEQSTFGIQHTHIANRIRAREGLLVKVITI